MSLNKSLVTNLISILFILVGYIFQNQYSNIFYSIGFFALSGSVTNWLAVQMLFEKVPFYGSGVILDRFLDIKEGIKNLVLEELFSDDKINEFFKNKQIDTGKIYEKIDFNRVFEGLLEAIETSKLGSMLSIIGGRDALMPIKDPVINKLKEIIKDKLDGTFNNDKNSIARDVKIGIEKALISKLDELDPQGIKIIIENMIRKHLGWLIVWGGVFGGLFGLLFSIIQNVI